MSNFDSSEGRFPTAGGGLIGLALSMAILASAVPATPAQIAWAAFLLATCAAAWVANRGALERVEVERTHRERVFEGDPVSVSLRVVQRTGLPQTLVVVEDQFLASLSIRQRRLIPMLGPRWEAQLHYHKPAERHRGVYAVGPVRMWASDPLGLFPREILADRVTTLTVYPRPTPLPGFRLMGPRPRSGPTMENLPRLGQGDEIVSVRPYRPGDPPSRIHWRTSARRRELHTIELDAHAQSEIAIFLDLTRRSRFGTGGESTTEMAIGCATSIVAEAAALRHSISLVWARETIRRFPAGVGLAHAQLLLDRLAVVQPEGETLFWRDVAPAAADLPRGSRAVFVATAAATPFAPARDLVRGLVARSIATDVVLLDESHLVRIHRDQSPTRMQADEELGVVRAGLELAGARVFVLRKGDAADKLMPAGLTDRWTPA